jgi:hypothetical protein
MSLSQLYCQAFNRGFPWHAAKAVIRDLAESMFSVRVDRLTDRMMTQIAECLEGMEYDARRDPSAASRESQAASLCSEHQRDQIRTQASCMGWTTSLLRRFLAQHCWPEELHKLTHDQAAECLTRMKARRTTETQRTRRMQCTN